MKTAHALSALHPGETALVGGISSTGEMRQRLLDMGLVPGTLVSCVGRSPAGDPSAYLIRGAVIALRRRDAGDIMLTESGR